MYIAGWVTRRFHETTQLRGQVLVDLSHVNVTDEFFNKFIFN